MAALKKSPKINLLPQQEFESSTVGRVIKWAMSSFRIIVIVVEMVVMIAFLSRFWLDARNNDLNDDIKRKQAIISASSQFEKDFRLLQTRLKISSSITKGSGFINSTLNVIASYLPPDVILTSYSYSGDEILVKGVSVYEASIGQFMVNLDKSGEFSKVSLDRLSLSQEDRTMLTFSLKLTPKQKGV